VPDILVVNAGGAWRRGPLAEVKGDADWSASRYTVNVNLYGTIYASQLMAAAMKARAEAGAGPAIGSANGKICCVSSIMSLFASEGRIECKGGIDPVPPAASSISVFASQTLPARPPLTTLSLTWPMNWASTAST
jgi:NAD(P)-dependent dehydrogenase (short-subunit alcohol dehydrogenase family)